AAKDGNFPSWFTRQNSVASPAVSLWITNGLVQAFLIITLFASSTYQFLFSIASVAILPPYVFSGGYALKLAFTRESYAGDAWQQKRDILIGGLATLYGIWLCYAADLKYLLLATILFAPGSLIYMRARREREERMFTTVELCIALALTLAALFAVYEL